MYRGVRFWVTAPLGGRGCHPGKFLKNVLAIWCIILHLLHKNNKFRELQSITISLVLFEKKYLQLYKSILEIKMYVYLLLNKLHLLKCNLIEALLDKFARILMQHSICLRFIIPVIVFKLVIYANLVLILPLWQKQLIIF